MAISSQILLGIILGYILFSISESIAHKYLLHATRRTRTYLQRLGFLGKHIINSWFSHYVIHHCKTFKPDHVTQFSSKYQENELNQFLTRNNKRQVILRSYGLRVGNIYEKIRYLYPHILWLLIVCYVGGIWFSLGIIIPLFLYIWIAEYVHPYLHLPYKKAINIATPFMRLVLKTEYFKYLVRHHYLHHKYLDCNFNLILGADWFLGCHRSPTEKDRMEMVNLGLACNEVC